MSNKIPSSPPLTIDDEDEEIEKEVAELTKETIAHVYIKLPPPRIPILPFSFNESADNATQSDASNKSESSQSASTSINEQLSKQLHLLSVNGEHEDENETQQHSPRKQYLSDSDMIRIETPEEFAKLQSQISNYVYVLQKLMYDTFNNPQNDSQLFSANHDNKTNAANDQQTSNEQPTAIQLLKALDKANGIIHEIDRSRKENELRVQLEALKASLGPQPY